MTLRTLNYGNYGIFLIMGNAGFCPSTALVVFWDLREGSGCFALALKTPCISINIDLGPKAPK